MLVFVWICSRFFYFLGETSSFKAKQVLCIIWEKGSRFKLTGEWAQDIMYIIVSDFNHAVFWICKQKLEIQIMNLGLLSQLNLIFMWKDSPLEHKYYVSLLQQGLSFNVQRIDFTDDRKPLLNRKLALFCTNPGKTLCRSATVTLLGVY